MVCYIIYEDFLGIPIGYRVNGKAHYFQHRLGLEHPDIENEWSQQ